MKKTTLLRGLVLVALVAAAILAVMLFSSCTHAHSYTNMSIIQVATCSEVGVQRASCNCGDFQVVEIPKLEHTTSDWTTASQASCLVRGTKQLVCKICNEVVKTDTIPALGHDLVSYDAKAPSCSETGHEAYQACTRCSHSTYREIKKLAHTPGDEPTCTDPQICKVCENVIKPAKGHLEVVTSGIPATCFRVGTTDSVFCVVCEKVLQVSVEVPKRLHSTETLPASPSTCTATGRTIGEICTFVKDDKGNICGHYVLSQAVIDKASHQYDNDKDKNCNACGAERIVGLSACRHNNLEALKPIEATCTTYGVTKGMMCVDCGDTRVEQKIVDKKPHTIEIIPAVPAQPTVPGLTEGEFCTVCRVLIKQQEIVPALSRAVVTE